MGLGVLDLFLPGLDVPLTPGGDDGHVGGEVLDGQLKADLVVEMCIRDRCMLLSLGIALTSHHGCEAVEKKPGVPGASGSLRVKLHRKAAQLRVVHTLSLIHI